MEELFGPDFISVTDEDGNEFELELVDTLEHKGMFTTDRAKNRAKTFTGVAKAMAEQWG